MKRFFFSLKLHISSFPGYIKGAGCVDGLIRMLIRMHELLFRSRVSVCGGAQELSELITAVNVP